MRRFDQLRFANPYAGLPPIFFSRHQPEPLQNQFLVHFNERVAELLGIDSGETGRRELADRVVAGEGFPGVEPMALCYAGHQFGQYVPRLGDGRALLLGQLKGPDGRRWDLQLKGSGRTLYSRQGDGKAVLRSTIREHLCSAAMDGLGIPTSLSLAMFGSDEPVYRERVESGAMLIRVAPSHIRFGTFEYFFYNGRYDDLATLTDFTIGNYFPALRQSDNPPLALLESVIASTASLVARWQGVGFCHGVMNTDNMSIHGITIDYGPFGFLDAYDPKHICNHSDYHGRYAYDQQPRIALFNLSCLAQALLPLIDDDPEAAAETATGALRRYEPLFDAAWLAEKRRKLGLRDQREEDAGLFDDLLDLMAGQRADFTNLFRSLSEASPEAGTACLVDRERVTSWLARYHQRLAAEGADEAGRRHRACAANPKYVLRNYLAEQAIRRAEDERDFNAIDALANLLAAPFDARPGFDDYAADPPTWANRLEVSCSS